MAKEEDLKKTESGEPEEENAAEKSEEREDSSEQDAEKEEEEKTAKEEEDAKEEEEKKAELEEVVVPTQLGHRRFVYAAYLAGAILIAFVGTKLVELAWFKLQTYQPNVGEPRDEIVVPAAAVLGAGVALYYWRQQKTRVLAEEVAEELTKVTWPSRKEVQNSTTVVIIATLFSTLFFWLMDRFWGFLTNLVYGS